MKENLHLFKVKEFLLKEINKRKCYIIKLELNKYVFYNYKKNDTNFCKDEIKIKLLIQYFY